MQIICAFCIKYKFIKEDKNNKIWCCDELQGAQWMKQVVSFDKLKLTNNQLDDNGHVSYRTALSLWFVLILGF